MARKYSARVEAEKNAAILCNCIVLEVRRLGISASGAGCCTYCFSLLKMFLPTRSSRIPFAVLPTKQRVAWAVVTRCERKCDTLQRRRCCFPKSPAPFPVPDAAVCRRTWKCPNARKMPSVAYYLSVAFRAFHLVGMLCLPPISLPRIGLSVRAWCCFRCTAALFCPPHSLFRRKSRTFAGENTFIY